MTGITEGKRADWLADFRDAVRAREQTKALAVLETRATAHAGTPPSAEKQAAVKAIVKEFPGPEAVADWVRWLAGQDGPTAKEIAALLTVHSYPARREEALTTLRRLADDGNWEVREWAGSSAGELMAANFDELYPAIESWLDDPSQFVRRAVAIAAKGAADKRHLERAEPLLRLMDRLVIDRGEEVRRNTGPFAVGAHLLRRYPEQTIGRVRRWAASDDEMSRWNAAMVFSAADARNHADAGLEVLSGLASDDRKLVWMAVASALRNLVKRAPDRVVPELREWVKDARKLPASRALRGVEGGEGK